MREQEQEQEQEQEGELDNDYPGHSPGLHQCLQEVHFSIRCANHFGVGLADHTGWPFVNTATLRNGVLKSSLSKIST